MTKTFKLVTTPCAILWSANANLQIVHVNRDKLDCHQTKLISVFKILSFLTSTETNGDSGAIYSGGFYNLNNGTLMPMRKYAVRVRLYEDRILNIKKKFFCDRTTEKTVFMTVTSSYLLR